jgi:FkbM family methyltransferase
MHQTLADLLHEPVEAVKHREAHALEALLASRNDRVVLFGTGNLGKRAVGLLRQIGIEPLAFTDNNKNLWGSEIQGLKVLAPAEAAKLYGEDATFLITIWNEFHWFRETADQLRSLGCTQIAPYTYLYWRFPEVFLPFLLNELPHNLYADLDRVLAAETLWADEQSSDIYRANIRLRALGDPYDVPGRPVENTYLPLDLFHLLDTESFLDCGATGGEMTQDLLRKRGTQFSAFHALEADQISFHKLESYKEGLPAGTKDKLALYNCAVGGKRGVVHFTNTGETGSRISEQGVAVELIPIDELFAGTPLTFVKMDIEGAEFDSLSGARAVLQRDQPVLAICVYHTQNDIWRIPIFAREMLPEHKLFLRSYEGDGFQTVMYAIPPERVRGNPGHS